MVLKLIAISRTLSSAGYNCMLQDKRNHLLLINDVSVLSSSSQICEIKVNCVVILEGGREGSYHKHVSMDSIFGQFVHHRQV